MITTESTCCSCHRHDLPADLFLEILCRLPVKSLLRFRCVSKSWLSLVDDDAHFARKHLNTFKNNRDETRLLVVEEDDSAVHCSDTFEPISETSFNLKSNNLSWEPTSSVDGLVLLKSLILADYSTAVLTVLKLWNPSLRQFHDVPPLPPGSNALGGSEIGLGYDPLAKDYKLVKLVFPRKAQHPSAATVFPRKAQHPSVAIYTLGAGSWKIIPFKGNGSCSEWRWQPPTTGNVYLKGILYFVATDGSFRDLISFDLSNEVFSVVGSKTDDHPGFTGSKEVALIDDGSSVAVFDSICLDKPVWALESETMNWTKRRSYPLKNTQLLHYKKNGDLMTLRMTFPYEYGDEVASYSPEKNEYKILRQNPRCTTHVSAYVESLILHNSSKKSNAN